MLLILLNCGTIRLSLTLHHWLGCGYHRGIYRSREQEVQVFGKSLEQMSESIRAKGEQRNRLHALQKRPQ